MSKTLHLNDQSENGHNSTETLVRAAITGTLDLIETDSPMVEGDYIESGTNLVLIIPDSFDTEFLAERADCSYHISTE